MTEMSRFEACRVCLADNNPICKVENAELQDVYEKLTNSKCTSDEPLKICYICNAYLKKCHQFMHNAILSEKWLTKFYAANSQNSLHTDKKHKLTANFCFSPIEYIVIEANCSVEPTNIICNIVKNEVPVTLQEELKIENDYQDYPTLEENQYDNDSEDDVPLKTISIKKEKEDEIVGKRKIRKRKILLESKSCVKDFKIDAKEIILTKEQQLKEMMERAKSFNYLSSPYKCDYCYKGFIDTKAYENHKEKHDERAGAHACPLCRLRYSSARLLRVHARTAHSRRYTCNRCAHVSHTTHQARVHEKWHGGHVYECQLCSHQFRKPTSYLTHMRKRHPTEHACDICGDSFVGRHGLLMHKTKAHKNYEMTENTEESISDRVCVPCDIQFASIEAWRRHVLSSAKHNLGNCGTRCRVCSVRVQSGAELVSHLRLHETKSQRPTRETVLVSCDQCNATFSGPWLLHAHMKRVHLGVKYNKNIVCEVCGKKCVSNASLKYHQRTHTGEKPYACTVCTKCFSDKTQLRVHSRTHTGEKPYRCEICDKKFTQKPALNRHYRVHTGAKPYECQYCSKTFSQSNSVKLHVRTVHLKQPHKYRKNKAKTPAPDTVKEEKKEMPPLTVDAE